MFAEHLTRSEVVRVLEIIQSSLYCKSEDDLRQVVRKLQDLVPYQAAVVALSRSCGPGQDPLATLGIVNVDYPEPYLAELGRRGLVAHDPVVRENFRSFQMQHWEDTFARQADPLARPLREIISLAEDFGFSKAGAGWGYAFGVRDPVDCAGSIFSFHGLARCPRTEEILELTVPHFHQALRRSHAPERKASPLTPRETEIMRWVGQGKTTWAVSEILSISERTVKFHVGNVIQKLDASTRAQAVAIAVEQRLLDLD